MWTHATFLTNMEMLFLKRLKKRIRDLLYDVTIFTERTSGDVTDPFFIFIANSLLLQKTHTSPVISLSLFSKETLLALSSFKSTGFLNLPKCKKRNLNVLHSSFHTFCFLLYLLCYFYIIQKRYNKTRDGSSGSSAIERLRMFLRGRFPQFSISVPFSY